ncbi:MAG: glycosyltransferase, partial [Mariprofundaceae bacterium]|nr:glycosyltransferase [Mariprofundaceae bacterium]
MKGDQMSMRQQRLCIAGGGTGGHVFPALALADAARGRWSGLHVSFIGAERGLEARLLPERGEDVLLLTMHSVQGAGMAQKVRVLFWELPRAVLSIWAHWRSARPHLVVGVGGYASVAGVLAAVLRRIPVVLYEQNAIPGMVNRRLAPFCRSILVGFS